jgi:hypothetical protein
MDNAFKPLGNTVAVTAASTAPTGVQAICKATHTAAVIAAYKAAKGV